MKISRKDNQIPRLLFGDHDISDTEDKFLCKNCKGLVDDTHLQSIGEKGTEFVETPESKSITVFKEHLSVILSNHKQQGSVDEMPHTNFNDTLSKETLTPEHHLNLKKNSDCSKECIQQEILSSKSIKEKRVNSLKKSIKDLQAPKDKGVLNLDIKLIRQIKQQLESKNTLMASMSTNADSNNSSCDYSSQESFYGICLYIKQNIPCNHISQTVPISFLFDLSLQKNIKSEHWHDFIFKELVNPQNFEMFKKRVRRKTSDISDRKRSIL